jgi:hypothetical protein
MIDVEKMNHSDLDGKTLFFHGPANSHEDRRPPAAPTIRDTERFGRLKVDHSGKAVRLEPIGTDSGWWIGFKPGDPEKFRPNKDRQEFRYLDQQVVPDFLHY